MTALSPATVAAIRAQGDQARQMQAAMEVLREEAPVLRALADDAPAQWVAVDGAAMEMPHGA